MLKDNRLVSIYVLIDPISNDIRYVGKTISTLRERFRKHLSDINKSPTHKNNWLKKLISQNKLPIIRLIDTCSQEEYVLREIHWIKYYKDAGYQLTNSTNGGEGTLGYKLTKEQMSNKIKAQRAISKPVYMFNKDGSFIQKFTSPPDAAAATNISLNLIYNCLAGYAKSTGGYIWSYNSIVEPFKALGKPDNKKHVIVTNILTNEESSYTSLGAACKVLNLFYSNAYLTLKKQNAFVKNYTIRYA